MTQNTKFNVQDLPQTAPSSPEAGREVAKAQELNDTTLENVSGGGVGTWIAKKVVKAAVKYGGKALSKAKTKPPVG
jgi:hypothetical protein